ncbi:MAG: ABC transporter substrate-binding protein [Catonella sp.]|uniref:ABC transporter substrate-binding protein n=1 Tax=Catonella sp. TaxID=2382125 RepID=UPI003FA0D68E
MQKNENTFILLYYIENDFRSSIIKETYIWRNTLEGSGKYEKSIKNSLCVLFVVSLFINMLGCAKNDTDIVVDSISSSSGTISSLLQQYEMNDSLTLQESGKVIRSNGGPEEFFETPWLNPGTCIYNKALYSHLIVADDKLKPIPNHPDALATYEVSSNGKKIIFTLKDNIFWHNGVPDFKIQLLPSPGDTDSKFVTRVKSGNLDYGYTKSISDLQEIEGTPGITVTYIEGRYTRLFYVYKFARKDGSPSPLSNKKVRQALRYAVDMKTICENIMQGYVIPADVLIQETNAKAANLNKYDYNPKLAKKLLAEAKWNSNTVLKTVYYYKDKATVDFMKTIQEYLAAVGVKMEYKLVEGDLAKILWTAPTDKVNGPRAVDWDLCYGANLASSLHEYYDRYLLFVRKGTPQYCINWEIQDWKVK